MPLRKTVAALRRRLAQQKRITRELARALQRTVAVAKAKAAEALPEGPRLRFSPRWVRQHRKRLRMGRKDYAKLVGVSAQSIFGWESGRSRPRRQALEAWRRIRAMGARELKALLEEAKPARRKRAGRKARGPRPKARGARRKARPVVRRVRRKARRTVRRAVRRGRATARRRAKKK